MHKIKIVEKVHIRKKNSARSDEGFRSYGHLKTADSYTLKNFDNFGKYAISVNMEAFTSGKVRQDYYAPANQLTHRSMNQFWYVSTIKGVVRLS